MARLRVAIFGSGGMAKEVIASLHGDARYEIVCVVSSEPRFNNPAFAHFPIYEHIPADIGEDVRYILAVSMPDAKRAIVAQNRDLWITYAHPSCFISPYAKIGKGCVFAPQAIVAGDPTIGDFVFFNTNATVGHDSRLGDYTTLFPNTEVCGDCDVGEGAIFGIGAYVVPGRRIVAGAKVSAGAIVRKDVLTTDTVYGDPAAPRLKVAA